jgi:preprotein translocase subunit SecE
MAKKERQKRSARKARAAQRAALEAKQVGTAETGSSDSKPKAAAAAPKKAEKSAKKNGIFARIGGYFRDVKNELHRVVWPSKRELRNYSVATIAMLIVFGVFFWLVDTGFIAILVGYTGLRG